MTYLRDGAEHLTIDELTVFQAVADLVSRGKSANTSQVAVRSGLSRSSADRITSTLRGRGYLRDASSSAAHHWRQTGKVPANGS